MYNIKEIVADLELDIKMLIKQAVFNVYKARNLMKSVTELIEKELQPVKDEQVKDRVKTSLIKFTIKQWKTICHSLHLGEPLLLLGLAINNRKTPVTDLQIKSLQMAVSKNINTTIKTNINAINNTFSNLADSYPTTKIAHQPLDSQVEMWQRHEDQEQMVDRLKQETDLVIVSSHSNCSKRCAKWQGKVLSLSNKTGMTTDGKKIYPLKQATDVFVTTKAGKTWKNGLLGFNCRHKLLPYKPGMRQPHVSEAERKQQYDIDLKQREFERQIRKCKADGKLLEGAEAQKQRLKAKQLTLEYEQFCMSNGRAFYKSRIVI